jgi:hypothetical protein
MQTVLGNFRRQRRYLDHLMDPRRRVDSAKPLPTAGAVRRHERDDLGDSLGRDQGPTVSWVAGLRAPFLAGPVFPLGRELGS